MYETWWEYISKVSFIHPKSKFIQENQMNLALIYNAVTRSVTRSSSYAVFFSNLIGYMKLCSKSCKQNRCTWHNKQSHLQFADDTLFFAEPDGPNLVSLVRILNIFCLASGLKINLAKSVVLSINLREHETQQLANIIGCSVGSCPIKYLGLPLGGNPLKKEFWVPVLVKIDKWLEG